MAAGDGERCAATKDFECLGFVGCQGEGSWGNCHRDGFDRDVRFGCLSFGVSDGNGHGFRLVCLSGGQGEVCSVQVVNFSGGGEYLGVARYQLVGAKSASDSHRQGVAYVDGCDIRSEADCAACGCVCVTTAAAAACGKNCGRDGGDEECFVEFHGSGFQSLMIIK